MEILKLILAKYVLLYLLQSVIAVMAVYAFNKKKIEIKMFALVTLILGFATAIIRLLPINFGVHTLLILIILILLGVGVLKTPVYRTVLAALFVIVTIILCEFITGVLLGSFIGFDNINEFSKNEVNWSLAGIPSNILFFIIIFIIYRFSTRKKSKGKDNGKPIA